MYIYLYLYIYIYMNLFIYVLIYIQGSPVNYFPIDTNTRQATTPAAVSYIFCLFWVAGNPRCACVFTSRAQT